MVVRSKYLSYPQDLSCGVSQASVLLPLVLNVSEATGQNSAEIWNEASSIQ